MTARSTWKGWERRVAHRLGGRRRPVTGLDRGDGDCFTPMFEVSCKLRKGQPAYLLEWLSEIRRNAVARGRIGLVVWKTPGRGRADDDALVVLRWSDFIALHGVPANLFSEEKNTADGPPGQPIVSDGSPSQETRQTTFW